jgi:hypothetical protein
MVRKSKKNIKNGSNSLSIERLLSFISLPIFIVSISIGLFFIYITESPKNIIYVYPTPKNVKQIQYKDKMNQCFQYESIEKKCPKDRSQIESYQVQE